MKNVGSYEAKTHLPKLLDRVMKGERITITKHGVPVAVLQPPDEKNVMDVQKVIEELRRFRSRHKLGDQTLSDMIKEGRK